MRITENIGNKYINQKFVKPTKIFIFFKKGHVDQDKEDIQYHT